MIPLEILQTVPNNEDVGLISVLIAIISALIGAMIYLHKEHKDAIKKKDAKIEEITENHKQDLKEGIDDYKSMIDKYYLLFERVKDWQDATRRRV